MLAVVVAERDRGDGGKVWFIARNFLVSPLFALHLILNILKCINAFWSDGTSCTGERRSWLKRDHTLQVESMQDKFGQHVESNKFFDGKVSPIWLLNGTCMKIESCEYTLPT